MSFRDQLREWLGGQWEDFWDVPPAQVWIMVIVVAWLGVEVYWRTRGASSPAINLAYHAMWPLRLFFSALILQLLRGVARDRNR